MSKILADWRIVSPLILGVIMLHCTISLGQESSSVELEKVLANLCRTHKVPSLSVVAVRSDKVVALACSGVRKAGTNDAIALKDRHPIGSNTKSMTATLAGILVESGKINWDTTISEVFPKAGDKHLHPDLRDVTLDELLSHQSGLMADLKGKDWLSFFKEKEKPKSERQRMLELVMKRKPKYKRGEFHYSNLGYVAAAAMLEKRAGEDYETLMREKIFQPLEMDSADFRTMKTARKLNEPLLWGHDDGGKPISPRVVGAENPSVYAPCGTINITLEDYAKYAQWHLRGDPAPLLSRQGTFDHLHAAQVDRPGSGDKYGCGWIIIDMGVGEAFNHGGSNTNSYALIWLLPHADFAAIACSNAGLKSGFPACNAAIVELMTRYAK